jgi:hypothetical protein
MLTSPFGFQYDYALLAPVVIGYLGLSFVIVYFGSLVCGSLLTILFHKTITITELLVPQGQLQEFYIRYYCSRI